jgi:hypothetical protein
MDSTENTSPVKAGTILKWVLLGCMVVLLFGNCDWFSSDEQDAVVKTLLKGYWPMGEFIIFWNGKNDKNEIVSPGKYYVRLYSETFSDQKEMTAQEGGGSASNDSTFINEGFQSITELLQNYPNPFKVKDGTNIHFTLSQAMSIELTIRDRK